MNVLTASLFCAILFTAPCVQSQATSLAVPAPAPAAPLKVSRYVGGTPLNYAALLPAPPATNSAVAREDAQAVHSAERTRTPAQVQSAQADDHEESIFALTPVLGPNLTAASLPLTAQLSLHLRAESAVVNPALKTTFNRPRPFVADSTIHPVCDRTATNSYPSGHAMVGYLEAFALVQMVPERKEDILRRASDYAQNRIVCGVHYPTDIEASHTIALALFGTLSTSHRFQQELAAAKTELRKKLHLPPA